VYIRRKLGGNGSTPSTPSTSRSWFSSIPASISTRAAACPWAAGEAGAAASPVTRSGAHRLCTAAAADDVARAAPAPELGEAEGDGAVGGGAALALGAAHATHLFTGSLWARDISEWPAALMLNASPHAMSAAALRACAKPLLPAPAPASRRRVPLTTIVRLPRTISTLQHARIEAKDAHAMSWCAASHAEQRAPSAASRNELRSEDVASHSLGARESFGQPCSKLAQRCLLPSPPTHPVCLPLTMGPAKGRSAPSCLPPCSPAPRRQKTRTAGRSSDSRAANPGRPAERACCSKAPNTARTAGAGGEPVYEAAR
jgi:hypothetical protein